jgi:integrase
MKPFCPDAVLKRHVLPAAKRAEITKKIGWHSFRRTLATLLQSSGASVKTTQELLRHSSPLMTMGTYAKAVTADKRNVQDAIAALFVEKGQQISSMIDEEGDWTFLDLRRGLLGFFPDAK